MYVLPDDIQFDPNLSSTLKSFLRALAHHCGDKTVCWPSQSRIAEFMNCCVRTVQRCEKQAIELKLIRAERRWLKSNLYHVLCLEERLSTMATQESRIEQNSLKTQRLTASYPQPKQEWKTPAEILLLVEDISEVFGPEISQKNRGWFYRIAQRCKETSIYEALSWIKQAMFEAECSRSEINSPSALFCWHLRQSGAYS